MNTKQGIFTIAIAIMAAGLFAGLAAGNGGIELYGVTEDGRLVTIDIDTGQATELFDVGPTGSMTYHVGSGQLATIIGDPGEIKLIDPLTGNVSPTFPVTGLPAGEQKTGQLGYEGTNDRLLVTFGQTGTFVENRIAHIDLNGVVQQTSANLGLGDNDGVFWDELNQRILVNDYNANDGFPRLAEVEDVFGTPTWTAVANPPSNSDAGDSAVHPANGRVFIVEFNANGGTLLELMDDSYVPVGDFNIGSQMFGIEFGPSGECIGDVNGCGSVDIADLLVLLGSWGACVDCPADLDRDDDVDVNDLLMMLSNWGPCAS